MPNNSYTSMIGSLLYSGAKLLTSFLAISSVTSAARSDNSTAQFLFDSFSFGVADDLNSAGNSKTNNNAIYKLAAEQAQSWLVPTDRPPLEETVFIKDGKLAFDSSIKWKHDKKIENQLSLLEKSIGTITDKIAVKYQNLLKSNPEVTSFVTAAKTEPQALHAILFLGSLTDALIETMPALQMGRATHVEFAATTGLLISCLMASEKNIKRVELITAIDKNEGKHVFVVVNRSLSSTLHYTFSWGSQYKIIDSWFNGNHQHGVYTSQKLPETLTDLNWKYWEARDITPPTLKGAPKALITFFNEAVQEIINKFSDKFSVAMDKFTKSCNLKAFKQQEAQEEQNEHLQFEL